MKNKHRNFFSLILTLVLVLSSAPGAVAAPEGKKIDPALEAIQALQQSAGKEEAPAQETGIPEAAPVPAPEMTPEPPPAEAAATMEQPAETATPLEKDVVLVLDNSGSMKKNDPQFLASQAVTEFINNVDESTRIAVIIFDQDVRIAVPLTPINDATRAEIQQSLEQINYKGLYTDSPAAIERAIYELKNSDRPDAKKSIIFMTDGIVDTGNAERDQEKSRWLREELAEDAADAGIAIFGIAFTEDADFQLIQSLARKTHGEYYRALMPEDLTNVYEKVLALIKKAAEPPPVVAAPPPPVVTPQPVEPAPPPAPVIIEVPAQPQPVSKQERLNSLLMLVALGVMIVAVIFLVLMVIRSSRRKQAEEVTAPEAYLKDIHGYTSQQSHPLGSMPTMLGRTAGTDTENMNYIVIPQTTIGRRHALIEYKDYAYWIVDQGSINGTFVNDQIITAETRLKHGDRIRLHKYEFEFSMPAMDDAGMTVVSHTVVGAGLARANEQTVAQTAKVVAEEETNIPEPDFDLEEMGTAASQVSSDEDTVLRGEKTGMEKDEEAADETIVMDTDGSTETTDTDATLRPDTDSDEGEDLTAKNNKDVDRSE